MRWSCNGAVPTQAWTLLPAPTIFIIHNKNGKLWVFFGTNYFNVSTYLAKIQYLGCDREQNMHYGLWEAQSCWVPLRPLFLVPARGGEQGCETAKRHAGQGFHGNITSGVGLILITDYVSLQLWICWCFYPLILVVLSLHFSAVLHSVCS